MPRSRRHAIASPTARATFTLACMAAALGGTARRATAQEPDAATRAAVLRAMVVLKLAPYLTLEQVAAGRKEYRIGVVGTDAVAAAIQRELPSKKVGDLPVVVVVVDPADAAKPEHAHGCDLLWLAQSLDTATQQRIVTAHASRPVALVADQAGFAAGSGTVQLFVQDNGVRFEVNAEALKAKGMRASPQLLKLSRKGPTR